MKICNTCSHERACERKLEKDGRCQFYIKDGRVEIDLDLDVNPMDTFTFDYEDLQRILRK